MESIVVEGATKRFTLRHAHSIKEMTVRAARRQSLSERFTALDEVSLTVERGDSLALMGLNGSGKSTLLKLISGVMRPDGGSVRVRGRVAGLIEVGAGLHPDLTGRENIFLNAAILGMSKAETEAKYDEIVAFAGIETFLDTQVKFYSSGMFMRLGFSVAVHTEPDVFLVDEVLAVGDPPFQKKCLERIQDLHAEGRTLVIVSHDMGTLEKVCDRGLVLRKGQVAYEGGICDAVDFLTPPENALEAERRKRAREEAKAERDTTSTARLLAETPPPARALPGLSEAGQEGGTTPRHRDERDVPRSTATEDTTAPENTAPARGARPARLRELDLLRFVAAVAVMTHHFTGVPQGSWNGDPRIIFPHLSTVTRFGHFGVNLFFLISGFVILMSVWNRTPGEFAVSRITRLFPAYWVSVALAFVLFEIPGLVGTPDGTIGRLLPNLTMLQSGIGAGPLEVPYWTLWVELHFYVLVALLVWRGVTYGRCVGFMTAWLFAGVFAQETNSAFLKAMLVTDWAPYFIAGMAFFLIHRYGSDIVLWLFVGCCWALGVFYASRTVLPWQAWPGVHEYVFPAVVTLVFLLMALAALHRLSWLRWRPLTVLGTLTYPLYLLHETVSRVVIKQFDQRVDPRVVLGLAVAAALFSAYAVHRLVERPAQRRLRAALARTAERIRAQPASGETSR